MVSRRNSFYPAPTTYDGLYDGYLTQYSGYLCHRVNSFAFNYLCALSEDEEKSVCGEQCQLIELCSDSNIQSALMLVEYNMTFNYLYEGDNIVYYADGSSGWIYVPIVHACGEPAKLSP